MMVKKGLNQKGQVTLFIIFGVVLVFALIFLFWNYGDRIDIFRSRTESPVENIVNCIEDSLISSEKLFFSSNDLMLGTNLSYRYNLQTMPFLCYSTEFYSPCVPQNPLFIEAIRKNMENKASRELSRCVLTLKEDYERKGYLFEYSDFNFSLIFNELEIFYQVNIPIKISKGDETILVSSRSGSIPSGMPNLLRTAQTIVNYESVFCEFDYMVWQAINRDVSIQRFRAGDQTKVYTLKKNDDEIKFAIRTCVMPAGI